MPDHAVCPSCGKVTEWTDAALTSEPELIVECDHCGAEINLYYADYVEDEPQGDGPVELSDADVDHIMNGDRE